MTREQRRQSWADKITEFRASGQSAAAWAKDQGIKCSQLYYWLRKDSQRPSQQAKPTWLPLELSDGEAANPLVAKVGSVTLEISPGFDPRLLLDVVNTLLLIQ